MARRRVLLKVSGEALCAAGGSGVDAEIVLDFAAQIERARKASGVELAIVSGGGNFLRGRSLVEQGMDRTTGDSMGMLATIMNSLALRSALERQGVEVRVLSAIPCGAIAEPFVSWQCIRHLEAGRVVLLAGGTGHPFFTTDTTAALRALEIQADVVFKGTKVRGIYSADPVSDPNADFFENLTFRDVLERRLRVMDSTAISLCMDNELPIQVFNVTEPGNIERALCGEQNGTLVA